MDEILRFEDVSKSYRIEGGTVLDALRAVSVRVPAGSTVSITGRSGSGKSTFLHLAAGIDEPSRGEVYLLGRRLSGLGDTERTLQRRDHVGMVFQFFHLLPSLTVEDNVALPGLVAGERSSRIASRARELLERVGLGDRTRQAVHKLSGGEMQRVAICRALLRRPTLLLADEPTGNLDDDTGHVVMDLLLRLGREEGSTLIYVTHSPELAALADERWTIHSGILETR